MNSGRKIKGFTLIEMLVTMSLSAIAIVFAYMAYDFIFGSFVNYQKMNDELKQYTNFIRYTNSLMNNSESMELNYKEINLKDDKGNVVFINFLSDKIIIKPLDGNADTLHVKTQDLLTYLGKKQISGNGNIDKLMIDLEYNEQKYPMMFEKLYDSEILMRLDSLSKLMQGGQN